MRKHIYLGILLALAGTRMSAQEMTFTATKHDFGTVNETNGDISHDFRFKNTGDRPLIIKNIITGCGCTSSEWSKKEYRPGEEGTIRMIYHPEGRTEKEFYLIAEVYTNIKKNGVLNLAIEGQVARPEHLAVSYFQPGKGMSTPAVVREAKDDYETILQRIREQMYARSNAVQLDKTTEYLLQMLRPEGKWDDLDYDCFFRTNWEPVEHLKRIQTIAQSYTNPQSAFCGNEVLYNAIETGLEYWNKKDPKCHNWWYNQIAVPQTLADILALMDAGSQNIPEKTASDLMKKMAERSDPRKWTGANKMDIAIHHLVRGCVVKNDSIVRVNASEIFYPVKIVEAEGIQSDLSYHQHGPQLYIGGYGTVFVDNVVRMGSILHGTKYDMTPGQLKLFSDFTRKTYLNVFRGHHLDFSVTGRGVSRKGILDYGSCDTLFLNMQRLDPEHANEYLTVSERFRKGGDVTFGRTDQNILYSRSDYMLQNRKNYDLSVRTASVRTCKTECGNGENMYGTYMSDGVTCIRVNGNEYTDIFPVWEWDRIPGTTVPAGEQKNKSEWGARGTATFTGGVSDGKNGVMTFDMNDYGMKARKSWFMFDQEIVCLGAGIESSLPKDIVTTVNQCHLDGAVWIAKKGKINITDKNISLNGTPEWIWHDSIAYLFPEEQKLQLKAGIQKGNWAKINYNFPAAETSQPVFNLAILHGKSPRNATYAYIIVPGISSPDAMNQYDTSDIKIECNTDAIQAVSSAKLDMLQIVFFQPGTFNSGKVRIEASKPCVVLVRKANSASPDIVIGDPTQKEKLRPGYDVKIIR